MASGYNLSHNVHVVKADFFFSDGQTNVAIRMCQLQKLRKIASFKIRKIPF